MSTNNTGNTSHIKPETQTVSDHTHKQIKIGKDGVVTGVDNLYEEHLTRHGTTIEERNKFHEIDSEFVAGTVHGFGRGTEHAFSKHPALTDITTRVPMGMGGRNYLQIGAEREHTYPTPARDGKPAGSVTKHNEQTTKLVTVEGNFSAGQLKAVKADLSASAREVLGGVAAKAKA